MASGWCTRPGCHLAALRGSDRCEKHPHPAPVVAQGTPLDRKAFAERAFSQRSPTHAQVGTIVAIHHLYRGTADKLIELLPDNRECKLAIEKLEASLHDALASIVRET